MFFILTFVFFIIALTGLLSKFKFGGVVNFIITLSLLYLVFLFITYTPDRAFYTYWIDMPELAVDKEPTFKLVASYIRSHNYDYQFLHVSFLSVYCFIYLYFISRFNNNVFLITVLYIPIVFLFYGTQLRYFLGYYSVLLGLYYMTVTKDRIPAIICFLFAFLSHYSLLVFVPVYFLLKIEGKFFKKIIITTIITFVGYAFLMNIVFKVLLGSRFISYIEGDYVSSYLGGLFTFATLLPVYYLVDSYYKSRLKWNPKLEYDLTFSYLYKMSLVSMVFTGIALTAQVIGQRVIIPGMLLPILMFFYKLDEVKISRLKMKYICAFTIVWIALFFHSNFSTGVFLGEWEYTEEIEKMIQSNIVLKYIIE